MRPSMPSRVQTAAALAAQEPGSGVLERITLSRWNFIGFAVVILIRPPLGKELLPNDKAAMKSTYNQHTAH